MQGRCRVVAHRAEDRVHAGNHRPSLAASGGHLTVSFPSRGAMPPFHHRLLQPLSRQLLHSLRPSLGPPLSLRTQIRIRVGAELGSVVDAAHQETLRGAPLLVQPEKRRVREAAAAAG
eukprot:CAMPEP_0181232110 /NCGR_PEP_ID=MMETSP1096-20121128/35516_1 /TAXON_ID=156174 ORGANISM="Chrysochromulina ericina, Strain CCMP281" /NCGR_SAMPLE_ID=MMETSP1096 /ASSEMBLY_ACC=CAM_ASM_000453 /LENGTH=117 /DNA_ID=CAMNT_0023326299 /DNA_START=488 /DNA_END=838 /DNA_ORIENTATION=+